MILAAWQSDENEYCTNSTIQTGKIKGIPRGNQARFTKNTRKSQKKVMQKTDKNLQDQNKLYVDNSHKIGYILMHKTNKRCRYDEDSNKSCNN